MLVRFIADWKDCKKGDLHEFNQPKAIRLVNLHIAEFPTVAEARAVRAPVQDKAIRSAPRNKKRRSRPHKEGSDE